MAYEKRMKLKLTIFFDGSNREPKTVECNNFWFDDFSTSIAYRNWEDKTGMVIEGKVTGWKSFKCEWIEIPDN